MSEITINLKGVNPLNLYGVNNNKLKLIKSAFPKIKIHVRGEEISFSGADNDVKKAHETIEMALKIIDVHGRITKEQLQELIQGMNPLDTNLANKQEHIILYGRNGKPIQPRTANQKKIVTEVGNNDIVFAVGPAGTGKTYTAVALAVKALKNRAVKKIILTRPAVEAGENLGFLPGDLKDKVDPFLRPLYDALDDMIPSEKLAKFMDERVIEVAPLAFMRGRTLNNAFIILDEAQNATPSQLKMFLTRIGPTAKCVITGDLSQIDLPRSHHSGLKSTLDILKNINGISRVYLNETDVVRHKLVKQIIMAFDKQHKKEQEEQNAKKAK